MWTEEHICFQLSASQCIHLEARDQLNRGECITDENQLPLRKLSSVLESPLQEIPAIYLAGSHEALCTEIP